MDRCIYDAQRRSNGDPGPVPEFAKGKDDSVRRKKVRNLGDKVEKFRVDDIFAGASLFDLSHHFSPAKE